MSKRYGYPIFIILTFVFVQVGTRLLLLIVRNHGGNADDLLWVFTGIDFLMTIFVPVLLLIEARENKNIKRVFYGYLVFAVIQLISHIVQLAGLEVIPYNVYYWASLAALAYVTFIGLKEEKEKKEGLRIGRAIVIAGGLNVLYLFLVPDSIQALHITYDLFGLNTFVLLIIIVQGLIMDEVLVERQRILDLNRVTLESNE